MTNLWGFATEVAEDEELALRLQFEDDPPALGACCASTAGYKLKRFRTNIASCGKTTENPYKPQRNPSFHSPIDRGVGITTRP